ncbi:M23 family metallopeptidase [uncultured Desulfosarcina sp.]|uniref:M23 family metallopeptidase n=1 Tax=uncultured Desulfosarcina sp. TaxID=218289 RepID=UPI0029C77A83|nr:M23 family metallopeptidase [uncultured Desulfosarcina sp.]
MMVMMKKKLTLLIFDAAGTPVKQTTIPRVLFPMTAMIVIVAAIVLYLGISDYLRLKNEVKDIHSLRTALRTQEELAVQHQSQIVSFSNKINSLNTKLAELGNFEQKIRIIANLEPSNDGSSLFGVGGSDPEDLDPSTMMEQDYQELVRDMHVEINEIDQASHDQQNSFSSILNQLEGKRNLLAATPSIRPLKGWISSRFGYRESPFTGRREFHRGLDIATFEGSPIITPADGIVTYAGNKGLMGNMVTIEHGFGMVTRYGHTQKILKKKGDRVKRGEVIALVGNTGRSTGPHLHYEVRLNGVAVNPMNYFLN